MKNKYLILSLSVFIIIAIFMYGTTQAETYGISLIDENNSKIFIKAPLSNDTEGQIPELREYLPIDDSGENMNLSGKMAEKYREMNEENQKLMSSFISSLKEQIMSISLSSADKVDEMKLYLIVEDGNSKAGLYFYEDGMLKISTADNEKVYKISEKDAKKLKNWIDVYKIIMNNLSELQFQAFSK